METRIVRFLLSVFIATVSVSLSASGSPASPPPTVMTSLHALSLLVREVGEGDVRVEALFPPAQNLHALDFSPSQLARIRGASLIFLNGGGLEPTRRLSALRNDTPRIVTLYEVLNPKPADPHLWIDPQVTLRLLPTVQSALCSVSPAACDRIVTRSQRLADDIQKFLVHARAASGSLTNRRFLAMHDAWGGFASAVHLEQARAITDSVSGHTHTKTYTEAVTYAKKNGIRVFVADSHTSASVVRTFEDRHNLIVVRLDETAAKNVRLVAYYEELFQALMKGLQRGSGGMGS